MARSRWGITPATPIAFTDANLTPANIKSGVSIFNVTGSYSGGGGLTLMSNVHRDKTTTQLTQDQEINTYSGANLPAGYREISDITKDDDGFVGGSVTTVNRSAFIDCGTTQNTIAGRVADCATANGVNATWDGATKGNAGQGDWKLVTRSGANNEVWQDQRTKLIWSTKFGSNDNWCRANGNAQSNDPSSYCNSATYQPQYPTAQSLCAESGTTVAVPGWCSNGNFYASSAGCTGAGGTWTANTEDFSTGVYSVKKGGMGKISSVTSPSVMWRLPSIYDYKLADVNGIRFVMPDMAVTSGGYEWSASVNSSVRAYGWLFYGAYGNVLNNVRDNAYSARCVGR